MEFGSLAKLRTINLHVKLYKILAVGSFGSKSPYIDSIDGLTFRNQLTGPQVSNKYQKMLKLDYAFFESMAENM